jgi:hypothetical protein
MSEHKVIRVKLMNTQYIVIELDKLSLDSDIDKLKRFQLNSLDWACINYLYEYENAPIELD